MESNLPGRRRVRCALFWEISVFIDLSLYGLLGHPRLSPSYTRPKSSLTNEDRGRALCATDTTQHAQRMDVSSR